METVKFTQDGAVVSGDVLLTTEAARARHMMALLMRKLGPQGMAELFADEIAAHADDEKGWHSRSNGKFAESVAFAEVGEGSAREFIDWFVTGYTGPNAPAMQRAHPDHLGGIPLADGRICILEVPGHSGRPGSLRLRVLMDWSGVPIPLDPDMPHRIMGQMETAEGEVIGYLLHQFCDTVPGFRARLAVYWPAAAPGELVEGHSRHLMVEFNNWFRMYLHTRSQKLDLMPAALSCGL